MPDAPTPPPTAVPELDADGVEAAARAAFFQDDLGGHIAGRWTWDTIPDEGRANYRAMVRATIRAYLSTVSPERGDG